MQPREELSDEDFIRHRLYNGSQSAWRRYADLVLAHPSVPALIRYELITTLFGSIPGALGMALRAAFYRFLFQRIGRGVVFGARVRLRHPERIHLGDGVMIDDDAVIDGRGAGEEGVTLGPRVIVNRGASIQAKVGAISIGEETNVGASVTIISQGPIRIEENVSIAGGSTIAGGRYVVHRSAEPGGDKQRFTGGEIRIGRAARLGMNALVQDGVTIGEGAIVAPSSVVMTDVEAHTVVSGYPARLWRDRKVVSNNGEETRPAETTALPANGAPAAEANGVHEVAARVRTWLEETRFADFGEDGLADGDSLFDHEILDSLGMVSLVGWLEQHFDVRLADNDLVLENFDSLALITRFVHGRISAART